MSSKTIFTIGELRQAISHLADNDCVVLETTDLSSGDAIDLYPFYIDVIEGIQLTNGETISEVRFCQMDNKIEKVLFETDYVIYHEPTDYVIQFTGGVSGGGIVIYGDKDDAELDRSGDEVIIPCTDLPQHWKQILIKGA